MSENTRHELRQYWTIECCKAMDEHIQSVVAEAMAAHVAECHRLKPRAVKVDDEQPEAIEQRNDSIGDAEHMADKYHNAIKRAEAAEAALAELKEAMEWITCSGCSPSKGKDGRWRSMFLLDDGIEAATLADAILAAYRNTKAASVAEGTAISARDDEQKETTT